jgi:hypothetical protein
VGAEFEHRARHTCPPRRLTFTPGSPSNSRGKSCEGTLWAGICLTEEKMWALEFRPCQHILGWMRERLLQVGLALLGDGGPLVPTISSYVKPLTAGVIEQKG